LRNVTQAKHALGAHGEGATHSQTKVRWCGLHVWPDRPEPLLPTRGAGSVGV